MAEAVDYDLCGWRVASAVALPELRLWDGAPGAPDIVIAIGDVPGALADPILETPYLQADGEGRVRYTVAGVADFLVECGERVTIAPKLDAASPDVRVFLLGSVFGLLCNQRGLLPIHASAVEIEGRAVAFAGASGSGKSTMAMAFQRRGFRLLSDDVTPVAFEGGQVRFLPSARRIRLWSDSVADARWDPVGIERCRAGLEKFSGAFEDAFVTQPLAPAALFHLRPLPDTVGDVMLNRLHGAAAVQQVRRQAYRWRTLQRTVGKGEAMSRVVRAATGIPRHFELMRRIAFDNLDETVDAVVETVRAIP